MSFGGGSSGGGSIATDSDVILNTPVDGDVLGYSVDSSKWTNVNVSTTLNGVAALASGGGVENLWYNYSATGNITLDLSEGNAFRITLTGNVTLDFTGATNNKVCSFSLYVKQNASNGGQIITWPTTILWPGGVVPVLSTADGAIDMFVFESISGDSQWFGSLVGKNFKAAI